MKKVNKTTLLSGRQAREIDHKFREILGVPSLVLMENAGRAVAEEAMRLVSPGRPVAVFCGKGNNGGDGFVAARHMLLNGIRPDIFLVADFEQVKGEARTNLDIAQGLKLKIITVRQGNLSVVQAALPRYALIIDALLGIGLNGDVDGLLGEVIEMINLSRAKKLAADIPSGLDAQTGRVLGHCVKADTTVTFVASKRGMVLGNGPKYSGKIVVRDLGIPLVE